jgi:hypothetical protein
MGILAAFSGGNHPRFIVGPHDAHHCVSSKKLFLYSLYRLVFTVYIEGGHFRADGMAALPLSTPQFVKMI